MLLTIAQAAECVLPISIIRSGTHLFAGVNIQFNSPRERPKGKLYLTINLDGKAFKDSGYSFNEGDNICWTGDK